MSPAQDTAQLLQRYRANLAALYATDPELAVKLDALPFTECPALEAARDGNFTVKLIADNGHPVYAHSRHRPVEEARTLVEQQLRRERAGPEGPGADQPVLPSMRALDDDLSGEADDEEELDHPMIYVAGLGLGYHFTEMERQFIKPVFIVAEADLKLIKAAFCVTDFSAWLEERRLTLLTSADKATLHQRLGRSLAHVLLGLKWLQLPHGGRRDKQFHSEMRALMRDFVAYSRVQVVSLLRNARISCTNVAYNLPSYVGSAGVEVFRQRAAGLPAIIVAAGPSLLRNIDQLHALQDRAVIIAVQTVYQALLARGIRPHFVMTLDYHRISAQFFEGVPDHGKTALIVEPKAAWQTVDAFAGPRHLHHAEFADLLLGDAAPRRETLRGGSTVAHLAYYFAEHLGCDPIIFIGQDLSFTEGLYYPPGMPVERMWQPELGRFATIEMKQWERIVRNRLGLRVIQDIHGRDTYTDESFFVYAEQFQVDFLQSPARIIDATEGGMRFVGTDIMPLRQAAAQHCTSRLPADLFAIDAPPCEPAYKARVCAALEKRIADIRQMRDISQQTVDLLERLAGLVEKPAEFNRLITQVDELRSRVGRSSDTFELVKLVSQLAELRRLQADRAIRDDVEETPQRARRRLKRDREYVVELIDGCDFLLGMLPPALERLREQL